MLHPELQHLLDFALESGEVTEKHRQVLHNKATTLGQDIDELDMIIDGEILRLKKKEDGKQTTYSCPNCGSSIPKSSIKCGFCGFEISKTKVTGIENIDLLKRQLKKIDIEENEIRKKSTVWKNPYNQISGAQNKASIISTFSMPNDKEHLLEFFLFCDSNADSYPRILGITYEARMHAQNNEILRSAWSGKAKLGYNKLKRFENEDDEIRELIEKYKIKYHQDASDLKAISINTNQGNGKAVLFGLNQTGVIIFFATLFICFPMCWLPFILPTCKAG